MIDLSSETFRDKVYGCWLGKNCGGTLGAPLEKAWGEPEPFDVWWYPELQEGGIPNDDLEMQLIWLKALEEVGPEVRAADLAQYWLDHIGYNWDEYGLSKTNLRLGLLPPVSGAYNNWFKHCMGCPIRSEIWACVAPGLPAIAVRYAYEDAICDHAGGESVYGELFNTAVESAAFVLSDREHLLDIGLSYVPEGSETRKAISAAREAYAAGEDWKAARAQVLRATPHYNAQYSPINMGFQVIGWLYGEDFGDAICKAVNCGYDTDCTGATLGSILGIIMGGSGLPRRWTEPLGESITTNESWGGIRHASSGSNPIPTNLTELTDRVIVQAKWVLMAHGMRDVVSTGRIDPTALRADEAVYTMLAASPMRLNYRYRSLHVGIDYVSTPAVVPGQQKSLVTHLTNPHPDAIRAHCELRLPDGWLDTPAPQEVTVQANSSVVVNWDVSIPSPADLENTNHLSLSVTPLERPAQPAVPVVLIGAHKYRYAGPYSADGVSDRELFDRQLEPEQASDHFSPEGRPGVWTNCYALDNSVPLSDVFVGPGVLYVQTYLWSPIARHVWIGAAVNCPAKLWINGALVVQSLRYRAIRPNYGGDKESYATVQLVDGWNEVFLKFVRSADALPFECHLLVSTADRLHNGLPDIGRTRMPWDVR